MRNATGVAVIGACFGDEGKGLITDYLCKAWFDNDDNFLPTCVVRFSGGAQAGHTVVLPNGKRHVFHHIGAGTLAGADTFLAENFICNPLVFNPEFKQLEEFEPHVIVHPNCPVTTHADMLINELIEIKRDREGKRHGSTGLGINETVERHAREPFTFQAAGFPDEYLGWLMGDWVPERLRELDITESLDPQRWEWLHSENLLDSWKFQNRMMREKTVSRGNDAIDEHEMIVFEGSQGLLLDQDYSEFFPHLTRANTGTTNIMEMQRECPNFVLKDVYYVMRTYMTRHGEGPFPTEDPEMERYADETNAPNMWQGSLRYGELDYERINRAIAADAEQWIGTINIKTAVTHIDQYDEDLEGNSICERVSEEIAPVYLTSGGPTHEDVNEE